MFLLCGFCFGEDLTLAWDHAGGDVDEFRIYRGEGRGNYPEILAILGPDVREHTIVDIPRGVFYYVITSLNEHGESVYSSNEVKYAYYYARTVYEYNANGTVLYRGQHQAVDASLNDVNWIITRYYYSGFQVVEEKILIGAWSDRANLGW